MSRGGNLYQRYKAASQDSITYTLGYGVVGGADYGMTQISRVEGGMRSPNPNASIRVIIDKNKAISERRGSGAWQTEEGWPDLMRIVGNTVSHELGVHAGRFAMLEGQSVGPSTVGHSGTLHLTGRVADDEAVRTDNVVDRETHWVDSLYGVPWTEQYKGHQDSDIADHPTPLFRFGLGAPVRQSE